MKTTEKRTAKQVRPNQLSKFDFDVRDRVNGRRDLARRQTKNQAH